MKIHIYDGVPHIARKDVGRYKYGITTYKKFKNGRYYVSLENFIKERKKI